MNESRAACSPFSDIGTDAAKSAPWLVARFAAHWSPAARERFAQQEFDLTVDAAQFGRRKSFQFAPYAGVDAKEEGLLIGAGHAESVLRHALRGY
jgi:hypothetical protein